MAELPRENLVFFLPFVVSARYYFAHEQCKPQHCLYVSAVRGIVFGTAVWVCSQIIMREHFEPAPPPLKPIVYCSYAPRGDVRVNYEVCLMDRPKVSRYGPGEKHGATRYGIDESVERGCGCVRGEGTALSRFGNLFLIAGK